MALEVLAGGDFCKTTSTLAASSTAFGPADPSSSSSLLLAQEKVPIKQYVLRSIIKRDFVDPSIGNGRLHIPGQITRRVLVNAIVSYLGSKQKADSLMDYFTGTVAIVAGVSVTENNVAL